MQKIKGFTMKNHRKKHYFYRVWIIICFIVHLGCNNKDIWQVKNTDFDKKPSYNYSEYISGELDSLGKIALEQSKEDLMEKKETSSNENQKRDSKNSSFFESIRTSIKEIYKWFINLI